MRTITVTGDRRTARDLFVGMAARFARSSAAAKTLSRIPLKEVNFLVGRHAIDLRLTDDLVRRECQPCIECSGSRELRFLDQKRYRLDLCLACVDFLEYTATVFRSTDYLGSMDDLLISCSSSGLRRAQSLALNL
jgi:hypothetical protein